MDSMAFQSLTLLLLRRIEDVDDHAGLSVVSYLDCHIHLVPILPCRGKGMTRRWEASKKKGFKHASLGPCSPTSGPRCESRVRMHLLKTRGFNGAVRLEGVAPRQCARSEQSFLASSPQVLGGVRIPTTFETKVLRLKHPGDTHQHAALP